jgi:glycosyltransferase involved in cell wall biosynthesis
MQEVCGSKYDFDICFLSILLPPDDKIFVANSKTFRSQNITAIQLSIIDGLSNSNIQQPYLINTPLLSLFPKGYKYPVVRSSEIKGVYNGVNHSFKNVPVLYSSSLFYGARKHLKKCASSTSGKKKLIIAYSLTRYTLKAMRYVKSIDPSIKTSIIVPDLPQYTYQKSGNFLKKIKNNLAINAIENEIKRSSNFVDFWMLFSDKMRECLPPLKNQMVFEGVATDLFENIEKTQSDKNKKTILYAGGLHENYGVGLLLDAFDLLDGDSWRLLLAGKGPMQGKINTKSKNDTRIEYIGEVPREKLLELEKNADVLVNPRVNSGIFTRYSFPSKNMEYLSSGTPMVGFKLDGIPDEYDDYINYFNENDAKSLAETIMSVCDDNNNEFAEKARNAREYVLNTKNKDFWAHKILQEMSK